MLMRSTAPDQKYSLALIWLLVASSSIVVIEPAPYDYLSIILFVTFFAAGLKAPSGIREPLLFLCVYLAANFLASVFVTDPLDSLRSLSIRVFLVTTWILLVSLISVDPSRRMRVVWNGYVFSALIACVVGIAGFLDLFEGSEQFLRNGRVRGFFKDPNVFGPFLVPPLLYVLARSEEGIRFSTLAAVGVCALLVAGVFLSYSRGAWLNAVVAVSSYLFLRVSTERDHRSRSRLALAGLLLLGSGAIAIGSTLSFEPAREMFEIRSRIQNYDFDEQTGRFVTQLVALEQAAETPIGIGPGQSGREQFFGLETHNLYLHVLVEAGWIGAAGFYAFLALTLIRGWRVVQCRSPAQKVSIVCYAAIIGILAQSLFIDSTHWRHFFLLLACLWAYVLTYAPVRATRLAADRQLT